jgi:hypothetical protein
MSQLTAQQRRTRARVETVIHLMAPALNLVLAVGERISRLVEREDHDYFPPRAGQVEPPRPGGEPRASED